MKRLLCTILAVAMVLCMAVSTAAADGAVSIKNPDAVILDASYTPINAAPVFCNVANMRDKSYTPHNRKPVQALRDNAADVGTSLDEPTAPAICDACGNQTLYAFAKGYYKTAACGHRMYFKGAACSDMTECGYTCVNQWIPSDECAN